MLWADSRSDYHLCNCTDESLSVAPQTFRVVADTLRQPAFFAAVACQPLDCVIANPPFLEKWAKKLGTILTVANFAGMPPSKSGDYAWVQHHD